MIECIAPLAEPEEEAKRACSSAAVPLHGIMACGCISASKGISARRRGIRLEVADEILGNGRIELFSASENDQLVLDMRLLLSNHGAPMAMMIATMPSIALGGLVLGGFEVAGGILGDGDVRGHPAGDRVGVVGELPLR
jgi:hypothetical protein